MTTVSPKRKFVFRLLDRNTRTRNLNTTLDDAVYKSVIQFVVETTR